MGIFSKICLLLCFSVVIISYFCSCDHSREEEEPAFGGVSIKVYRGPSKVKGRKVFAPFGYYVKMPVDSNHQKKEDSDDDQDDDSAEFKVDDDSAEFNKADGDDEKGDFDNDSGEDDF